MRASVDSNFNTSKIEDNHQSEPINDEANFEEYHESDLNSSINTRNSEIRSGKKVLKLVLVGNTTVGKTCLIKQYLWNQYTDLYEPSVLDVFKGTKNIDGHTVDVEIHDTSGDEHLGTNRKVQY